MEVVARQNSSRTNLLNVRTKYVTMGRTKMEQAAQKLIKEREQLNRQIETLRQRVKTVETALEIIELRLGADPKFVEAETSLDGSGVFRDKSLPESCRFIFELYDGWLDKNQVEYLLTVGGYRSEAKDPVNSVDVTLRRMATAGECEVTKGAIRNRFRAVMPEAKQ